MMSLEHPDRPARKMRDPHACDVPGADASTGSADAVCQLMAAVGHLHVTEAARPHVRAPDVDEEAAFVVGQGHVLVDDAQPRR